MSGGGWEEKQNSQKEGPYTSIGNSAERRHQIQTSTPFKWHMMPLGKVARVQTSGIRLGDREAHHCANGFATLAIL